MRVVSCMILLAMLCTSGTGCALFKKNGNNGAAPGPGAGAPPPKFPQDPLLPAAPPANAGAAAPKPGNSILAGTVIDAYHRPIGNAYIRWSNLNEKDAGAPIDVATDANGHFIIQGVEPGASYKLIARTKQGEKLLAGTVLTSAPDVRVVIPIREDLVNASTPPLPGSPAYDKGAQPTNKNDPPAAGASSSLTKPKNPTRDPLLGAGKTPDLPATLTLPATSPTNAGQGFVPGVVAVPFKDRPPMLSIPSKPVPPAPPHLPPADSKLDTGPTRVPSCALVGSHLENLALKDSQGHTWEYKKHAAGKLVLLDFWATFCPPCRETMPHLNRLHTLYASRGLEVIGIALEPEKDERKAADAVNRVCAAMKVSYRQLMGRSGSFDIANRNNFKIDLMPTLMLLNEQGDIIYQFKGQPSPATLSELERLIKSRLDQRTY